MKNRWFYRDLSARLIVRLYRDKIADFYAKFWNQSFLGKTRDRIDHCHSTGSGALCFIILNLSGCANQSFFIKNIYSPPIQLFSYQNQNGDNEFKQICWRSVQCHLLIPRKACRFGLTTSSLKIFRKKSSKVNHFVIISRYNLTINRANKLRYNRRYCCDLGDMGRITVLFALDSDDHMVLVVSNYVYCH